METQCSAEQLEFQGIGQRSVVVSNDADVNSSDAGLVPKFPNFSYYVTLLAS
jgi:hypothetical protein